MKKASSFNAIIENTLRDNWNRDALTDYQGITLQYHDVARKIEKLHILFEYSGIKPGDKIAVCGRNSAAWGCAFLAAITFGAVIVPIQHEFTADQIYNIINHSDSRLIFVGNPVCDTLDVNMMPNLDGMFSLHDFSLLHSRSERLTVAREHLNELYGQKYPMYFRPEHIHYYEDQTEELAMINYTSGTTGFSKGVMLPYRALWGNLDYLMDYIGDKLKPHCDLLSILPMSHMYGLMVEFLLQFACGNHIYFLTRMPSPTVIQKAFAEIKPGLIVSVPLIIEKIIRAEIFPLVKNRRMQLLLRLPVVGAKLRARLYDKVMQVMGGNTYEIIIGGASFSKEVEDFLTSIHFPITVGYGTTETAPMITFCDKEHFVPGSCGMAVRHMQLRVTSKDPEHEAGELVVKGMNTMLGYYKNPQATAEVLDKDGWFHTGDLVKKSSDGHVFILGRIKNMLLGANGQNVYPEEIEDKLNSMTMVNESLILQRGDKLVGLVHPNKQEMELQGCTSDDIMRIMEQNRKELNEKLPKFCKISEIKLYDREFERTPKKSIKRYLYQNNI